MNRYTKYGILGMLLILFSAYLKAEKQVVVYKIDIKKEIDNTSRLYLSNGLNKAKELDADAIIIHLNTYGGLVDVADSMRTAILYSPIPVFVFIDNNAASAGALISIAAKKIYMRKGANIGAATVVNQTGEAMPDKYQSYMRSMIRSTAEAHGKDTIIQGRDTTIKWLRDPAIAEAMVDDRVVIPNLIDSGKVLTFTAEEAVKWGYCDGIVESTDEIITQYLGYTDYQVITYTPSWLDDTKGFLMSPILQSLLILIIIGGIYFELQTPGIGFPSAAAIVAAILYFAPLYIDGLAENWEILIFIVGILLIAAEIFVIPGFGIAGIGGIILAICGLVISLLNNTGFDFKDVTIPEFGQATLTVLMGLGLSFALMIWLSNKIGSQGIFRKVALTTVLDESTSSPVLTNLIGKEGTAATVLRPSGKVWIEGELYDGVSDSGFIEKGSPVKVIRFENAQVYVQAIRQ
ncbi:membrane-bound serine protease (ClpP class) [Parabacteroides sp. PF5-5]|nr:MULTISPECIES: NfeD family protein [unclassified Parabacteroides]MDH6304484.1 membrane-bound serine protease (ClpP class) [Parabacteroides sp. PH5-39]MDH6315363.1 membrane-bound serine protease (ClpP class) [Parabacteroides sp. PF5-13]MDH6319143.1 membrane-bound serine protease (ClpP class) [Parabacteroides sp. PH5-13]MDH6322873.1 membrane-bound serine protease (ClpP class) [Parabacteroides sp. PH5-8]MDH6326555.1 membrane-bound serine protease (ClpP class) [Parabacteroides sp. PH5-41]